jgi:hypothetical protein
MSQPAATAGEPIPTDAALLRPRRLAELYLAPSRFFARERWLDQWPTLLYVMWAVGAVASLDRLEQRVMQAALNPDAPASIALARFVADSWVLIWFILLIAGAVSGVVLWLVGGWWYRVRLRWAGATAPDRREARATYAFVGLVTALPSLVVLGLKTLLYPNFLAAAEATSILDLVPLVFVVWSVAASYRAVRARFDVTVGGARLWFLALPLLVYLIVSILFGLFTSLMTQGSPASGTAA